MKCNNWILFLTCRQTLRASACSVLDHIKSKAMDYSVLGIDEGQFVSLSEVLQIFDENISIDTNILNKRQGLITKNVFILVSRCCRVFRRNG